MTVVIRPVERSEVVEYLRVLPFANGLPSWEPAPAAWHAGAGSWPAPAAPASAETLHGWVEDVMADGFRSQAAFVDGRLVGGSALLSLELTVPGPRTVRMGGVTSTGVPQAVAQLPWGHVRALLDRLPGRVEREWYAARAVQDGWSRAVLEFSIGSGLRARVGAAPSNFTARLPAAESDLAQALVRDPYVFDTLGLAAPIAERDLEQALMTRLQATLLEFGRGMVFVGRQVRLDVGDGYEVVVDLLLFNVEQLRYVVVELKVGRLAPGDVGQLGVYVAVVDDKRRRREVHAPTVGLLLVAGRSDPLAQYAPASSSAPVAVADWASLPADTRAVLPPADRIAAALDTTTLPGGTTPPEADTEEGPR